jgi:hypothetical protein
MGFQTKLAVNIETVRNMLERNSKLTISMRLHLLMLIALLLPGFSGCGAGSPTSQPPTSTEGEWAWEGGANVTGQTGTYGTLGTAAPSNMPGAREGTVTWTDASGNRWLFGGTGPGATANGTYLNDLWKYAAGEWTWMAGANVNDQVGTYGTQGVAAPGNIPGARTQGAAWSDPAGNGWLFGGFGYDSTGVPGQLNDLWKYNGGQWTWMGGSNTANQIATYGTLGTPAAANIPGARYAEAFCGDGSGNVWLFGGSGNDSTDTLGVLNDFWKYNGGQWTWMSGSTVRGQLGNYGVQGTPAPGNVPSSRDGAVCWLDSSGDFWLFGGSGYDSTGTGTYLNDLWKYSAGQWTWVSGSNIGNQNGTYGTLGVAAPGNVPGGRAATATWKDVFGDLWLFGGMGYDSTGHIGNLNDLWRYSAGQWTWMGGADIISQVGIYGTQGIRSSRNVPGAREGSVAWTDSSGNLWLFGGSDRNDLWSYQP